jgi:hypothetical protein
MLMSQWNQKISRGQKSNTTHNMKSHFQTVVQNDCVDFVPISVGENFYDIREGLHDITQTDFLYTRASFLIHISSHDFAYVSMFKWSRRI